VLDRLEALPPALRGLVQACAENRLDGDLLGFLADYLDEHGMQGGERVRLLRPGEGDVLVIWPHGEISPAVLPDMRATAERLTREYGMNWFVIMNHPGQQIGTADPGQLRAAGWVRVEELRLANEGRAAERVRIAEAIEAEANFPGYGSQRAVLRGMAARIRSLGG
jgi:hypothetical protein